MDTSLLDLEHARIVEGFENGDIVSGRGKNQETSLRKLGDTRWGSHYTTILRFIAMWDSILKVIENVHDDGDSQLIKSSAMGLLEQMESYEFVFAMLLMKRLLGVVDSLSFALQQKNQNIVLVVTLLNTIKFELQHYRENGQDELLNEINIFCVNHNISLVNMKDERRIHVRRKILRKCRPMVVDRMIHEMNNRFSEENTKLLTCMTCLNPRNSFSKFDIGKLVRLAELYSSDFSVEDRSRLHQQLSTFINNVQFDHEFLAIEDFGNLAQKMVQTTRHTTFPLVYRLIELALVLPVVTASVEPVFSDMKKIKNDLRNRMGDEWMNDIMIMHIEKTICVGLYNESILQRYQRMQYCRIQLSLVFSGSTNTSIRN